LGTENGLAESTGGQALRGADRETRLDALGPTVEDGEKVGGSVDRELGLELEKVCTFVAERRSHPTPRASSRSDSTRATCPVWREPDGSSGKPIPRRRPAFEETEKTWP
jgi:hypothetical protein